MAEIWKKINDNPNYEVSNFGRIKSISLQSEKILKQNKKQNGYLEICLYKNGKRYFKTVHRLVAENFITNFNNLPQINHKNGIKSDNRVENLEWCTAQYNVLHSINTGLRKTPKAFDNPCSKTIVQIDLKDNIIKIWGSSMEIERGLGIDQASIIRCCKNSQKTSIGYKWKYRGDIDE